MFDNNIFRKKGKDNAVVETATQILKSDEEKQVNEEKWIQKAIKKPGALHKSLGVPEGEKIPAGKLAAAAEKGGKLGKRARLAQTLKKMNKEELETFISVLEARMDKGDMDNDGKDEPDDKEYMDNKDKAIKKSMKKDCDEAVKVKVSTNKPIGFRVADIGPGKKEYNVKTDKVWDAEQKKKTQKEEVEQIDELSPRTLGSYVKKAGADAVHQGRSAGVELGAGGNKRKDFYNKYEKKADNRKQGIKRAVERLTKEESEQIDELSKKTLSNYMRANTKRMADPKNPDSMERKMKRHDDYFKASDKFHKEASGPTAMPYDNVPFTPPSNTTSSPAMKRIKEIASKSKMRHETMMGKAGCTSEEKEATDTLRGREYGNTGNPFLKKKVNLDMDRGNSSEEDHKDDE